ncbi:MMPL family transporter [Aliifodinibius sp. S!AR15-10]|uniref:efflux RND transporter permease subunit n=1 Tax=Aliifodinibius sp. S!AR15-10 TaxID=2950437 RepID=UPI0028609EBD|nr:MMPL family transporter [Aliifodinibius sp. S!AR15-10]MDR8391464.1 MMPL family transporter [Aliifodinibius sp. S!AR15-10]
MLRLADLIIRYRWWIIASTLLLTVILGWKTLSVSLNADFSTYLSQDDPAVQKYNRIGDIFGGNDLGVVLLNSDNEVFTQANLDLIGQLTEAYEEVEGISYVTSLSNVIDFRETEWGLEVGRLYGPDRVPSEDSALNKLQNYVLGNERYYGNLISEDSRTAAILLQFEGSGKAGSNQFNTSLRIKDVTNNVLDSADLESNSKLYFGGLPFLVYNMTLLISENLSTLIPIMIFLLVLVLYLGFRHWAGVVFPMIVVSVSVIWITGLMGTFGLEFDLLTGIMPVVLLALGSADGIHLMKRYYELRNEGNDSKQATRQTFKQMGTPIALTTITTTVGFASLFVSDFSVIKQFGLLTAVGVILALIVTLTLLPALLSFGIGFKPGTKNVKSEYHFLDRFGFRVYKHQKLILAGSLGIIVLAVIAIPKIEKDVDWSLCLARGSDPYHAEMMLREKFEGSLPVQVVVDGDIKDPAILQLMHRVERRLETIPEVGKPSSMGSVMAEINEVMNGRYQVPEKQQGVSNLWFLIEGEDQIERMVTPESDMGLVQAKMGTWHTGTLVTSVDSINRYLETLPEHLSAVNLHQLDPPKRQLVKQKQLQLAMQELRWYFSKEGISWKPDFMREVQDKLLNFTAGRSTRDSVLVQLNRYLASSQAEIVLENTERAQVLDRIAEDLPINNIQVTAREVSHMLESALLGLPEEDADWLAGSLANIINTTIGRARILPAIDLLSSLNPENDENFRENVKGILWNVNSNIAFLDSKMANKIFGDKHPAVIREVPVSIYQAGMPQVLKGMEEELVPTQIKSLLTALLFVLVLLAIIHKSTIVALIAIIPISLTILINFGVMGYLGIGLDSFTAMIASIAIGLGIDTDIHFISRYRDELIASGDKLQALQETIKTTGMSILINALAVGLGFLVLLFAGGQHIRRFGGLTSLTVLVSATLSLTLLAVLIIWLKPKYLVGHSTSDDIIETTKEKRHETI